MITADPHRRAARLAELARVLSEETEDRERLLAFVPIIFQELPDRIALDLPMEVLAARVRDHFRFVAREMPPASQLYKGLPGIHVVARNPSEPEALALGAGRGFPVETTVVETHTLDAPFILESLKNYFRKAGIRVFAGFGIVLTVRRQWEKIVVIAGPHDEWTK